MPYLTFPVRRNHRRFTKQIGSKFRVNPQAVAYLSSVLEYLVSYNWIDSIWIGLKKIVSRVNRTQCKEEEELL